MWHRVRLGGLVLLLFAMLASAGAAPVTYGQSGTTIFLPLLPWSRPTAALVADLTPGSASSQLDGWAMAAMGDTLFFVLGCGDLWKSDGTTAGTVLVRSFAEISVARCPFLSTLTPVGDRLFFVVQTSDTTAALWRSDGTPAGTFELARFASTGLALTQATISALSPLAGDLLFFVGVGDSLALATDLWRSDGTLEGTRRVYRVPGMGWDATVLSGELYFSSILDFWSTDLWVSDGSAAGTRPVLNTTSISALTAAAGRLWFSSRGDQSYTLWTSDGSAAGTRMVHTFSRYEIPYLFSNMGGAVYFTTYVPLMARSYAVWRSDGTAAGTTRIADGEIWRLIVYDQALAFIGEGRFYWSDGTSVGTRPVGTVAVDSFSPLLGAGDRVYFVGSTDGFNGELWASDGTAAGTRQAQDINPGAVGAWPEGLTLAGARLFFTADDGAHGRELWALPVSP